MDVAPSRVGRAGLLLRTSALLDSGVMLSRAALAVVSVAMLSACAVGGELVDAAGQGGAGGAGQSTTSSTASVGGAPGEHGCFDTEALCGGACVDVLSNPQHCGGCDQPCAAGDGGEADCVNGECTSDCAAGFAPVGEACTNFVGAHEIYPSDCAGCATPNGVTNACSCPGGTSPLALAVQSDCPGVPMRAATTLSLCHTSGLGDASEFGGAYQIDDIAGQCGATASCRMGNPLAGGACACPAGYQGIETRSIIRLPCNGGETGTRIVLCNKNDAPIVSFGGAYQYDDLEPRCRVANPRTGACSCPAGTNDRVYRVMVDGGAGLYGSTLHLCTL